MKTKWGSCNKSSELIWFNLELIKKPRRSIEYVVVHELVHLLERNHTDEFKRLLSKYYPKWQEAKRELNDLMLAYEEWEKLV